MNCHSRHCEPVIRRSSLAIINYLIPIANDVLPKTDGYVRYIKTKLNEDYMPSVNLLFEQENATVDTPSAGIVKMQEWKRKNPKNSLQQDESMRRAA